MADRATPSSGFGTAVPSAPYSYRAPSPPFIHIPVPQLGNAQNESINFMPSFESVDSTQLSSSDLVIITQNAKQIAVDRASVWLYEQRREAQPILDFLYLGPNSVVRDHAFLQREGITMVIVARDSRMPTQRLRSVDKVAEALGIATSYVDVEGPHQLIQSFPAAIRLINDHLLGIYHSQAQGKNEHGQILVEASNFRRGKVLLTCETGNDRSAAIVGAYIMAIFGKDMVTALQFISVQRFCCGFDEDLKRVLQTWDDILQARSAVAQDARSHVGTQITLTVNGKPSKRGLDNMMDVDGHSDAGADAHELTPDEERFQARRAFTPFQD